MKETKTQKASKVKNKTLLSCTQLRRICNAEELDFKSTENLSLLKEIIGQDRAVCALMFGMNIKSHGFNIYALGPTGTGKTSAIVKYLEKEAIKKPVPPDWIYVNNFSSSDKPRKMQLPAGKGSELREDMDRLVLELKTEVPKAFEAENYKYEQEAIEKELRNKSEELLQALSVKASNNGIKIVQSLDGFSIVPLINGKMLTPEALSKLNQEDREKLSTKEEKIIGELHEAMREFDQLRKGARQKVLELDQRVVSFSVNHFIATLKEKYKDYNEVVVFLDEVKEHLLKNVQTFKRIKQTEETPVQEQLLRFSGAEPAFDEYRINLIVDNSKAKGAPVVFEKNPIGPNLVGRIEQQGLFGALITNFSMIKGGALHRANGGYLILDMLDVLKKPFTWEILKRALKNKEIVIENIAEAFGAFVTKTLEPEPIPLEVKVVLLGDPMLYYLIHQFDPEFRELFKIKADFANHMSWEKESIHQYAEFIGTICSEEKIKHVDPSGVAKIVEYGARVAGHQQKLSLKFGEIADIIRQSAYFSNKNNNQLITSQDVQEAITAKIYRSNYIEELMGELIKEKALKISIIGQVVGQINGLSVLSLGDYSFGKPTRITACTYVGNDGIINVEREIELSGKIYNKGSMIISGYLGGKYAKNVPIALSASIAFEQVYEEVDGDSASAAEIYALLSSICNYPLRQDLAITGSVNQHGEIQAIGGVNEKIEGFYQACKTLGLTGTQGVIIPESNIQNLMLNEEIIEEVKKGKFHIHAISTIDEGIELLMDKPAGVRQANGVYPKDTINWAIENQLLAFAKKAKKYKDKILDKNS